MIQQDQAYNIIAQITFKCVFIQNEQLYWKFKLIITIM
ncbi:unnamed protein product [Paramecium sonneborni]|uniref:Uncharacterized protein n=1 Tax=Paramecium sonneborni TaxID=65129 RepID=A0A8S1RSU0_9CILI|nr:unnamed protein product [Paramecium sonneborni]